MNFKIIAFLSLFFCIQANAAKLAITVEPYTANTEKTSLNNEYLFAKKLGKSNEPIPLVIYLHGAGGIGDSVTKIKKQVAKTANGFAKHAQSPFYFVAPQTTTSFKTGGGWQPKELNEFLSHLKQKLNIDTNRIYLTGNSMGGMGTWYWAASNKDEFAAIAPVSGGIGGKWKAHISSDLATITSALDKLPVYAYAGLKDKVVPAQLSETMINTITQLGNKNAHIKLYPNGKHDVRKHVYADPKTATWLFSQRK